MKYRLTSLLLLLCVLLAGCSGKSEGPTPAVAQQATVDTAVENVPVPDEGESKSTNSDVVEISERLFIAQTNDIYINAEDYFGKTIKYEGLFKTYEWPEQDMTFRYVIRYGPGCCGDDGDAGFEVAWDGEWPKDNDWCEAVGTLEEYEMNGWMCLRLKLSSLKVLDERGAEFVSA